MFTGLQSVTLLKSGFQATYYGMIQEGKPVILFVHGAGGNGLLWSKQLKELSDLFSTLAVNLPGHGDSGGEPFEDIFLYSEFIHDFQNTINIPQIFLCGHSMGGAIAIDYALRYPEYLGGIILVATGGKLRVAPQLLEKYRAGFHQPELASLLFGSEADGEMIKIVEEMLSTVPPRVSLADFIACNSFNVLDRLEKISLPVLILCGEEDNMTPPKFSRFLKEKIHGSILELFSGCGHMLMLEKPREVNNSIKNFLVRVTGIGYEGR